MLPEGCSGTQGPSLGHQRLQSGEISHHHVDVHDGDHSCLMPSDWQAAALGLAAVEPLRFQGGSRRSLLSE